MRNLVLLTSICALIMATSACDDAESGGAPGTPTSNTSDGGSGGAGGTSTTSTGSGGAGGGGSTTTQPDPITSMKCDALPGTLEDTPDSPDDKYAGACVTLDWTDNPCTIAPSACPDGLFFDWERAPGGYFNLKFFGGTDVLDASTGTVNHSQPPATWPDSVSNLPEGVDITVKAIDPDSNIYQITFRRDGDVVTIAHIIKMAI